MTTLLRIGPADRDRRLTLEEFTTASFEEGFKYELIDGRLTVAPAADPPHENLEHWLSLKLALYALEHPTVINRVSFKARVFIPGQPEATTPEPDVTAYADYPTELPYAEIRWQELRPLLVVEVISPDDPNKDLERNANLYHQVPSIREYWVVDPRPNPDRPSLYAFRRRGRSWRRVDYGFGDLCTTRLLPGFRLVVDPRAPLR